MFLNLKQFSPLPSPTKKNPNPLFLTVLTPDKGWRINQLKYFVDIIKTIKRVSFRLGFCFNDISATMGYLKPKVILVEGQYWYCLTNSCGEDKRVHAFPKSISLKLNVIAWLKFEVIYYDVAVQHVSHYAMGMLLKGLVTLFKVIKKKHQLTFQFYKTKFSKKKKKKFKQ